MNGTEQQIHLGGINGFRFVSRKSRLGALLLALFLGAFGAHRFYVGKVGTGLVMFLLTITLVGLFVTGLWAFIDFIMIACGEFRDADGLRVTTWDTAHV